MLIADKEYFRREGILDTQNNCGRDTYIIGDRLMHRYADIIGDRLIGSYLLSDLLEGMDYTLYTFNKCYQNDWTMRFFPLRRIIPCYISPMDSPPISCTQLFERLIWPTTD
ncbi:hypothetical protein TNCT_240521 [Trichonephila clavata]|uniref:Uncharacterized protein n=1 Tax=Trichonephila clavata TaxID=2740835 RepID=A0A8X6FE03_TRICU|nr:hypothetical protein TNCT_240521 [Trichonephila clavata]